MTRPKVGLLVTCLVDFFRPQVGFAAVRLLELAQCDVLVPPQTCCGQPAYNAGDPSDAAILARKIIAEFEACDYLVVPSGSCAGMIRQQYPQLLKDDSDWSQRAQDLAAKTHELFSFLVNIRGMKTTNVACDAVAAYHDSCSCLRELKVFQEPRTLLAAVSGLELHDIPDTEVCCGFGGFFAVKYPDISARMADDKLANAKATGANLLVGADLGCLLHLAGRMGRNGHVFEVRHAAEVLADMAGCPAIGDGTP